MPQSRRRLTRSEIVPLHAETRRADKGRLSSRVIVQLFATQGTQCVLRRGDRRGRIKPLTLRGMPAERETNRERFRSRRRAGVMSRRGLDRPVLLSRNPGLAGPPAASRAAPWAISGRPLRGLPNRTKHQTSNAKGEDETIHAAFVFAIALT